MAGVMDAMDRMDSMDERPLQEGAHWYPGLISDQELDELAAEHEGWMAPLRRTHPGKTDKEISELQYQALLTREAGRMRRQRAAGRR